jgi:hypothetical protein
VVFAPCDFRNAEVKKAVLRCVISSLSTTQNVAQPSITAPPLKQSNQRRAIQQMHF